MTQSTETMSKAPLLDLRDLQIGFNTQDGPVQAVKGINLTINHGETVAIVGESGSGKSTTAMSIINLLPGTGTVTGGEILFEGKDLAHASEHTMQGIRGADIGLIPQDPMSNLNPVWSIGFQVEEALTANGFRGTRKERKARVIEVLENAGLANASQRLHQYPHQFSGGMRQRVLIGIGLAANPKLLIADEPTSALDVTVQKVILDHLATLTGDAGTAVLFITHDLGLAAERAEKLVVMYRGEIVESGSSLEILSNPQHPYTKRLIAAAPSIASRRLTRVAPIVEAVSADELPADAVPGDTSVHVHEVKEAPVSMHDFISVTDLTKVYKIRKGGFKTEELIAANNVSFDISRGTTTAIVGESGSGKSTVAKLVLQLEQKTSGSIRFDGQELGEQNRQQLLAFRRRVQPVFQDPYGTLDPMYTVGNTIAEPLRTHKVGDKASRLERVRELLDQVALPPAMINRYPNELSGGQRQRVAIARALALKPDVIVLDEAVSALDVLVQGQILNLLTDLQSELNLTYLFITHDLAVVRLIADNVCVMKNGQIVESSTTDSVFDNPQQQYTQDLLRAIPGSSIEIGV